MNHKHPLHILNVFHGFWYYYRYTHKVDVLVNLYYVLKIIFLPLHMTSVYLFFISGVLRVTYIFRGYMQSCKRVTLPSIRILAVHLFRYGVFFPLPVRIFLKNLLRKLFITVVCMSVFSIGYVIVRCVR